MSIERYLHQIDVNGEHINTNVAEFSKALRLSGKYESFVTKIKTARTDLTPLHFGLLIYASYQYALLTHFTEEELKNRDWSSLIPEIETHYSSTIENALFNKNVNITEPRRYGGMILATHLLGSKAESGICDIGCGFYPKGIGSLCFDNFPKPADGPTNRLFEKICTQKLNLKNVVAVDNQDPDPKWTAACTWLPISALYKTYVLLGEKLNEKESSLTFIKANVLDENFPGELGKTFDIVFAANIMYQFSGTNKNVASVNIGKILKEEGWFLSMEYLEGGSRRRPFTYGITGYRKESSNEFSKGRELLVFDSADCQEVKIF